MCIPRKVFMIKVVIWLVGPVLIGFVAATAAAVVILLLILCMGIFNEINCTSEAMQSLFFGKKPHHTIVSHPSRIADFLYVNNLFCFERRNGSGPPVRAIWYTFLVEYNIITHIVGQFAVVFWGG